MKIKKQLLIPLMALCAGCLPGAGEAFDMLPPEGYEIKNDGVYFGRRNNEEMKLLKNADKATFKVFAYDIKTFKTPAGGSFTPGDYGMDGTRVYYNEKIIKDADPYSFEALIFIRFKNKFKTIYETAYSKDRAHVYYKGGIIETADPASLELLVDADGGDYYFKDKSYVYYINKVVKGADPKSLQVLNNGYAKDKTNVYRFGLRVDGDPDTFEILDYYIVKDKSRVWAHGRVWTGEDAASFEVLEKDTYLKDKSNVYYITHDVRGLLKVLEGADPASFKALTGPYAKDKARVWRQDAVIKGADPASFKVVEDKDTDGRLNSEYTKDKSNVYFYGKVLEKVDPASFKILGRGYCKDKSRVYYDHKILTGADPATFKVLTSSHAKDKARVYYYGKVAEGCNPGDFK